MTTITIWLLVAAGYRNDAPLVVERFATLAECERVMQAVPYQYNRPVMRCIQATVVRP